MQREEIYEIFGRLVAERRKRAKLTQEALAQSLNMSRASIANIERGEQAVQLHLIFEIAAILNVQVQELIPALHQGIETLQVKDWLDRSLGDQQPDPQPLAKAATAR